MIENLKIVSDDDAEKAAFVVCSHPPGHFPDDMTAFCSACGHEIVHRPTAPKKPPKICVCCERRQIFRAIHHTNAITDKTAEEVFNYIYNRPADPKIRGMD